jgi:hypothetical protein
MTLTQLRKIVRDLTKTQLSTDDGGSISGGDPNFTDSMINLYLTNAAHLMTTEIIQSNDDWDFQEDWATTDLVADQREYPFYGISMLRIKRVEACLDGTNWVRLSPIIESEISDDISTESGITQIFDNTQPYFKCLENSIYIYSGTIIAVTQGLKIWYTKEIVGQNASGSDITSFSATTDTPNIAAAYQEGLCYLVAKKFFEGYGDSKRAVRWIINLKK